MSIATLPAQCSAEEYHAFDAVSASRLKVLRDNPTAYCELFVAGTRKPRPSSKPQKLGTLTHTGVLEPDLFGSAVIRMPEFDQDGEPWNMHKPSHRAEKKSYEALTNPEFMAHADYEIVLGMIAAIHDSSLAMSWINEAEGKLERNKLWTDPATGMLCKARIDIDCGAAILDIKTTSTPGREGFAKACREYGYHNQAAWYLEATGATHFGFIAVGNEPPHEVGIYWLGQRSLALGRNENAEAMAELLERTLSNNWECKLELPEWAFKGTDL